MIFLILLRWLRCGSFTLLLCSASAFSAPDNSHPSMVIRTDRYITLKGGGQLFVREVSLISGQRSLYAPVLLIHGARVPGLASFDLPVKGGSLAEDLARAGFQVYILDLRGYGKSSRPAEMDLPPNHSLPLIRTADAVNDLKITVRSIQMWSQSNRVSLLGWATGGQWGGAYASQYPHTVQSLILYNSLYGGSSHHPTLGYGSPLDTPGHSGNFNTLKFGGWRLNTRKSLFTAWDNSIPVKDKSRWRDDAVKRAYGDAALDSDITSWDRTPPSFRAPTGALADSFELAMGRKQWSANSLVSVPVLFIRSALDFWSRPEDVDAVLEDAPIAEAVLIPQATHFVHLDRSTSGRSFFLYSVIKFLTNQPTNQINSE